MEKCNKIHGIGNVSEIDSHAFHIVWVLFSHQIPILWHISSFGKCMDFHINFSQYEKMQQNASNELNLEKVVLILFPQYGGFSPCNFHPMVYFLIWEMDGFPNQFPIVQENATKPGKLGLILFPYYGCYFPIRFPFYGILHHMGTARFFSLISHNLGKDSRNH